MKRILFSGDIVGREGSEFFAHALREIKKARAIDAVIANGENSAAGNGITRESADFLLRNGADVITTGNHCFRRREAMEIYDGGGFILRPANYPEGCIGSGVTTLDFCSWRLAVINLMGVVYMEPLDNPFTVIDSILEEVDTPNIFVDFHAEATAEKKAMGHYLAGRVSAVIGTHTHVQTADEAILRSHTAYITDAGMTGPEMSVLGVATEDALAKFRTHMPVRFHESKSPCFFNGVIVELDEKSGKAVGVERVIWRGHS